MTYCDPHQHHPHRVGCCDYCDWDWLLCCICKVVWPCDIKQKHVAERSINREIAQIEDSAWTEDRSHRLGELYEMLDKINERGRE